MKGAVVFRPQGLLYTAIGIALIAATCVAPVRAQHVFDPYDDNDTLTDDRRLFIGDTSDEAWTEILVIMDTSCKEDPQELSVPERIEYYRGQALAMQKLMLRELVADNSDDFVVLEQNWLLNSVLMRAKPRKIRKIAKRKDVRKVSRNGNVRLVNPGVGAVSFASQPGTAWGVAEIGAEHCWSKGYDGSDVVIVHMDTGADPQHPALVGKFTGHWFDAVDGRETPYDDNGHGTHTLGTLLGGDGRGDYPDDLGVAPGARWVGVKVMDADGVGSYQACLAGLQYVAQLKARLDIRIVCGAWSLDDPKADLLFPVCRRLRDLGILTVFAAGNAGPALRTADTPANYPTVVGVGALDAMGHVAVFSARGDAPAVLPWSDSDTWTLGAWNFHKPDLTAPGVEIRSCVPGGGFAEYSGTSMAAPHVAGAAAILLQRDDSLQPKELLSLLIDTARPAPHGGNGPEGWGDGHECDTAYGWGRLDVAAAFDRINLGPLQPPAAEAGKSVVVDERLSLGAVLRDGGGLLRFSLPREGSIRVVLYNMAGEVVRTLAAGDVLPAGPGEMIWDGRDDRGRSVESGVYFARLSLGATSAACRMVLVR